MVQILNKHVDNSTEGRMAKFCLDTFIHRPSSVREKCHVDFDVSSLNLWVGARQVGLKVLMQTNYTPTGLILTFGRESF